MRLFKYRGGGNETFERDLKSLDKNCFWGANTDQLNDPTETLTTSDKFKELTTTVASLFGIQVESKLNNVHEALDRLISKRTEIGIYSLSQTFKDELLWAHYGNSHTGFCIEYDLDLLVETYPSDQVYHFPVIYSKHIPEIGITDVERKGGISIIQKFAGNKSERWKYEEEYRIIIDKSGKHPYDYKAVKAIYFGLRMDDTQKNELMNRLKGRGIKYRQIKQIPGTYDFDEERVPDPNGDEITYLCQIPKSSNRAKPLKYAIIKKDFNKFIGKATATIELESVIKRDELIWVAETMRDNLFWAAESIYVNFVVKDQIDNEIAWATAHFEDGKQSVDFNEYVQLK